MSDKKKRWDLSIVLALIAVLISVCTMVISLVETNIMQKQQQSMTDSAKATVWPYVTTLMKTNSNDGNIEFSLIVENKGVGPALMKNFEVSYDNEVVETSIIQKVKLHCPEAIPTNIVSRKIGNKVISPGEQINVLAISLKNADFMNFTEFTTKLKNEYCYSNIYGDCWKSTDDIPVESKDCQ